MGKLGPVDITFLVVLSLSKWAGRGTEGAFIVKGNVN